MNRKKKIILCLCLTVVLAVGRLQAYAAAEESTRVSAARDGVVRLFVIGPDGLISMGSGFGVGIDGEDADTFITNWHVVTCGGTVDYHDVQVCILLDDETCFEYKWVPLGAGEELVEGEEYGSDPDGNIYKRVTSDITMGSYIKCEVIYAENRYPDVAVLHTQEPVKNVKALPLKKAGQLDVGREVATIGYPGTADDGSVTETDSSKILRIKASVKAASISGGVVSRCDKLEAFGNTDCIVHDAHINHGNSGGPLVLKDGSVIGINTYGYGENYMEYSVSIYIDYAIEILDQLGFSYTIKESKKGWILELLAALICVAAAVVFWIWVKKRKSQPDDSELYLRGVNGVFEGQNYPLRAQVCMGRNPQKCNLVYPPNTKGVSGIHCVIQLSGKGLTITDLHSTYGTAVNGKKLPPDQEFPLLEGDHLFLGSVKEEFQIQREEKHG